jgi:hypothetical protein
MVTKPLRKPSITLLNFGEVRVAQEKVVKSDPPAPVRFVADEERPQVDRALRLLGEKYYLGLNTLMRRVERGTDLRTIFAKQKKVPYALLELVAKTCGLTPAEFLSLEQLPAERQKELETHIREHGLFEPTKVRVVRNTRLEVFKSGYSR